MIRMKRVGVRGRIGGRDGGRETKVLLRWGT